ncbi:hypothetical protein DF018_04410 [Burkholderia cenocepacia]|nr:hypothetical protein DF039_32385 [Burkholderia cenocepacia]RQV20770.1 hypothetical protein DF132_18605 [Burkholderia cenocepacia]RQV74182.1 hypothetical protein DF018_04410 [Burkholderia cenocepacia]
MRATAQASRFDLTAGTAYRDARLPPPADRSIHRPATNRHPRRASKEKGARRRLQYAAACQTS